MASVVVIDTNVLVSALLGSGAANEVVARCIAGESEPLIGSALLAEYEAVPARTALWARCRLASGERDEVLDALLARSRWVRIFFAWRPNLRDESDNHVVELAVAGGAETIVTRNVRDFRIGAQLRFPDLSVLTPQQFLRRPK